MATTDRQNINRPPQGQLQLRRARSIPRALIEFQPDAVEIEKRSVPGGVRWTLYTVIALIVAAVVWACWAKVDRIIVANGQLVTTAPPIIIQPISSAPIREVLVKFGDVVKPGQTLALLDPTFSAADVAIVKARSASLMANIARLTAEWEEKDFEIAVDAPQEARLQRQVYLDRKQEFVAKMATFTAEREKFLAQQQANEHKIEIATTELETHNKLYEKQQRLENKIAISEVELLSAEINRDHARLKLEEAKSEKTQLVQDLELNAKQRDEYIASWRSKISAELLDSQTRLNEANEELNKANRMNELIDLRVPDNYGHNSYFVLEVAQVSVGSVVKPGESLVKLVPLDVPLEAEVDILTKDIGLIDQHRAAAEASDYEHKVRIKLDAFPYQKHGTLEGYLRTISEGTFQKGEPPAVTTTYRARMRLGSTVNLKQMPANFRLVPGMNVSTEIRVGERRVIEYFLYPLFRHLDSSIREP